MCLPTSTTHQQIVGECQRIILEEARLCTIFPLLYVPPLTYPQLQDVNTVVSCCHVVEVVMRYCGVYVVYS
jgi:hypothetical protein